MGKEYVTESMGSGRIMTHGKIAALPFSLASGNSFSIFIVPATDPGVPVIISCTLSQDDEASACPFLVNQWTEPAIKEIPAGAISLVTNDVYWGAGIDVSES